jgi:hypothetical protein
VPKRSSPAQLAKKSRRLNQKHLASKMWACVRVASRLLAWCVRARARTTVYSSGGEIERFAQSQIHPPPTVGRARRSDLDRFVEHAASLGLREAVSATVGDSGWDERLWPAFGPLWRYPILVGRLLIQQWPSRRDLGMPAPMPLALAAPPPATQLGPPPPPPPPPTHPPPGCGGGRGAPPPPPPPPRPPAPAGAGGGPPRMTKTPPIAWVGCPCSCIVLSSLHPPRQRAKAVASMRF